MRKQLLSLAVILAAAGFTSRADDTAATTVTLPTDVGSSADMVFESRITVTQYKNYIGALHLSDYAFETNDANEHIIWTVTKIADDTYTIKNKGLSADVNYDVYMDVDGSGYAKLGTDAINFYIKQQDETGFFYIQPTEWTDGITKEEEDEDGNKTTTTTDSEHKGKALSANGLKPNQPRASIYAGPLTAEAAGWKFLAPDSPEILNERTTDLASFCDNTIKLISVFQDVPGLIKEDSNIGDIIKALENVKKTVTDDNSPSGAALEAQFHNAHQAKIDFYNTIDYNTRVSLQAQDGHYLYNHLTPDGTWRQPHAHKNENGTDNETIGYAAIWHIENVESTNDRNNGLHIRSYYARNTSNNHETDQGKLGASWGIGEWGAGFFDHGYTPTWYSIELDGRTYEGILFTNANGYMYLNTNIDVDVAGTGSEITPGSLWQIERVYVPTSVKIVEAPIASTPETTADGDAAADKPIIAYLGHKTKLIPEFTSDAPDGKSVTPGLTGVTWESSNTSVATIEGIDPLHSAYTGDKHDDLNGFAAGEVTTIEVDKKVTIKATVPMYRSDYDATHYPFKNLSGEVEIQTETPTYDVKFALGSSEITSDDTDATISVTLMLGALATEVTSWEYTLTKEGSDEAITGTSKTDGTITLPTLEAGPYTLTITRPSNPDPNYYINDQANVFNFTVKQADLNYSAEITGEGIEDNKATIEAGNELTAAVSFKNIKKDEAVYPEVNELILAVTPEGVTAVITKDADTNAYTLTITTTEETAPGDYVITLNADPTVLFSLTEASLTITVPEPPTSPNVIEVTVPENIPDGGVATVDSDTKTATIGFNFSPAEGDAVKAITLPAKNEPAEGFDATAFNITSDNGIASAAIDAEGNVTVTATDNAAIGATDVITITPKTDGDETPEAMLTINVSIYGIEFTEAPAAANLTGRESVEVEFAAKAFTPEGEVDAEISCDDFQANDGVIIFTKTGTFTVTASVGTAYAAKTTVKIVNSTIIVGIDTINADAASGDATIYDLQGRRINRINASGVYIVNGVKTLVK